MPYSLDDTLSAFRDEVLDCSLSGGTVLVTSHIDCDGIASGSIMSKALKRAGAIHTVRNVKSMDREEVARMKGSGADLHIVTDLGTGFSDEFDSVLGDRWFVLDHHTMHGNDEDHIRVINAWKYGIDGSKEICAGGMAYLAANRMDQANADLSAVAVVSAIGDRQDKGERRSLIGKNAEIAETARKAGLVEFGLDIMLTGRGTKPLQDAMAFTSHPHIPGLTNNREACLNLLLSAGVAPTGGDRLRVPADLTRDEKSRIFDAMAGYAARAGVGDTIGELVGYAYTMPQEDQHGYLGDCREFATALNSCGRMGKHDVGMRMCIGDKSAALEDLTEIMATYKTTLASFMRKIDNEKWRVTMHAGFSMVDAMESIPDTMTGTVCSMLAASRPYAGKVVVLWTGGKDDTIKFSSRKSPDCKSTVSLNDMMNAEAGAFSGIGGGHDAAAGATIPIGELGGFLNVLRGRLSGTAPAEA